MKKGLEILLAALQPLKKPKISLEQYTIPEDVAAEIINLAYISGDIKDKKVVEFGCGSGRLAIGAAIAGAKQVAAVDIDPEAIAQAKENLKIAEKLTGKKLPVKFYCMSIHEWKEKCDTVLQNPPFGIKSKQSDVTFLQKATSIARKIYSLHKNGRKETREFLIKAINNCGCKLENIVKLRFFLPHTFKFHKKPKIRYDVDLYVISC